MKVLRFFFFFPFARFQNRDFPDGPVVKNPPSNAGNSSLILIWEDSTCRGATKPVFVEPVLCNKRSHHNEKPEYCSKDPDAGKD